MAKPEAQSLFSSNSEPSEQTYTTSTGAPEKPQYVQETPHKAASESHAYEILAGDASSPGPRLSQPQRPPGLWSQWWVEILNCILMIGTLCAIIGILYPNQTKPLPDWPFDVSINTAVSILSTGLKTCAVLILTEGISHLKWRWFQKTRPLHDLVVFDSASRGPWGCLRLLFLPRGTHFVASLGAGLILLTLAVDPFTQQLVRYYDCKQTSTKSNATLPRSMMYSEAGAHTSAGIWPPATAVLGYIDQGLYNPADIRTPFTCDSGNCTFDNFFSTLGFCSTCEDMSSQLTIQNVSVPSTVFNVTSNSTVFTTWVNTTLPSGSYAATGSSTTTESWLALNQTADGWTDIIQASKAFPGAPEDWYWDHYYATTMRPVTNLNDSGCTTAYDNNTWACSGFGGAGAARCKISPCVKTYRATVEQGQLRERLVRTQKDMFVSTSSNYPHWLAADLTCAGPEAVSRLRKEGFRINDDDVVIPWNVMVNTSDGTASLWAGESSSYYGNVTVPGPLLNGTSLPLDIIPAECLYDMAYPAVSSITDYLDGYLHGAINPGVNGASSDGPPQLRVIFNDTYASFSSINDTFTSVAEGITLRIRQYVEPSALPVARPVVGVVFEEKTCVDVRWPFLAFPAAVVTLTTAFLIVVIGQSVVGTGNTVTAGWKSSLLPIAFGQLTTDASAQARLDGESDIRSNLKEMETISKRKTVNLSQ
ncbi:hypothetical protein N8I77_003603 [Diaporthe amygdali]|uniref:Uncharacterized protein n=1 Tax=Phomopsis amygdali TaxID=1214568 RepID=A0AAD9W613_PHOAM|nr:hypothetical protein N8I77_003603 [Diaporthe amygdali]